MGAHELILDWCRGKFGYYGIPDTRTPCMRSGGPRKTLRVVDLSRSAIVEPLAEGNTWDEVLVQLRAKGANIPEGVL